MPATVCKNPSVRCNSIVSAFDVIKYPLSNPPTTKELNNLPVLIYVRFFAEPNWRSEAENPNFKFELLTKLLYEYEF